MDTRVDGQPTASTRRTPLVSGPTIAIGSYALQNLPAGGYMWLFLNWALGFSATGCRVIWVATDPRAEDGGESRADVAELRRRLSWFGLDELVVVDPGGAGIAPGDDDLGLLPV